MKLPKDKLIHHHIDTRTIGKISPPLPDDASNGQTATHWRLGISQGERGAALHMLKKRGSFSSPKALKSSSGNP